MDECFARKAERGGATWNGGEEAYAYALELVLSVSFVVRYLFYDLGFCAYIRRTWLGFALRGSSVKDASG